MEFGHSATILSILGLSENSYTSGFLGDRDKMIHWDSALNFI